MATSPLIGLPPLRLRSGAGYSHLIGVGGVGTGLFFRLDGDHPLGRNESRPARIMDARDYCKLHIICHYIAALMGADFRVLPIARVGADDAGRRLVEELRRSGVDTSHVKEVEGRSTLFSVCFLYPDGAGGNITSSNSAAATLEPSDVDEQMQVLVRGGNSTIALTVPEAPLDCRDRLLEIATSCGALRVASFASAEIQAARERGIFSRIDILALNEDEAVALAGGVLNPLDPEPFLGRCADILSSMQPNIRIVVSAGRHGAFGFDRGQWHCCPAPIVRDENTAGAGDALIAGIVSAIAAGMPFASALSLGVLLAAYSVTSPHTIHPDANLETLLSFATAIGVDCSPLTVYAESVRLVINE